MFGNRDVTPGEGPVNRASLDLADELRRNKLLSDELDVAKLQLDEARLRLDKTMTREKIAADALFQAHKDLKYACKSFGQHDWLQRAFLETCDKLRELGVEVSRSVDAR